MRSLVWLSFDLGIGGDYEGMYGWLDDQDAKDCGEGFACFWFSHDSDRPNSLEESLKSEIEEGVSLNKRSRMYVVRRRGGKMCGRFIFGRRKGAPWHGFGTLREEGDSDNES